MSTELSTDADLDAELRRRLHLRQRSNICFLCGELIAREQRTTEHFVSRAFYPAGVLPNGTPWTLPAHVVCNASTKKIEERVAHTLALAVPVAGIGHPEKQERATRALAHPKAEGFRNDFLAKMIELPTGGSLIPLEGLDRVLVRICRALWFAWYDAPLPPDTPWTFRMSSISQLIDFSFLLPFEVPDVLSARWGGHEQSRKAVWFLVFNGMHAFTVSTVTPAPEVPTDKFTRVILRWPAA